MSTTFSDLQALVSLLRKQCPWCKAQTYESLTQYVIEEAYEVVECIQTQDYENLPNELADLLFQVLFLSEISKERHHFDISKVLALFEKKHRERSPHIFNDQKANTAEDARKLWEQSKPKKDGPSTQLNSAKKNMPALLKAYQLQTEAADVNFDWPTIDPVFEKLDEEILELRDAINHPTPSKSAIEDEIGDILFTCVNLARKLDINPDNALNKTNRKFIQRFQFIETEAKKQDSDISSMTLEQMDELWQKAKGC